MSRKHILLICATGMSTNMLVSKMRKAAEKHKLEVNITAVSANDADARLISEEIDIILLGPQVRYMKSKFLKKVEEKQIEVHVIETKDYGMMNADKILLEVLNGTEQNTDE
ncbi:PTS sugar transporter subunit IIB [Marinilactibacillus psychrotolerans]|uniref:Cellobiose-specific PTS system IIB component n=1 Tax=Marinilactibacillus psychrotolerans TaxID=191770 RepID=A0A511H2X8_9LACT|nr:PTS sugar transporter subunit IIB [Marinilactibacillus psychrotolerans]TLQ09199.1 PTS sugar transporter subunit IIB [Marinilactibacillus psychrotolerans]SDD10215.1 PTS system, cellobiose-specific IIB component [Marinilactibacillus psychrotolerans]GEL67883.1 PTS sugar transporter subunit IIB [Marinilactibacillus psychrotolerans]GEQ34206.1 cellobiose-specific PTS system IIB component [Marinilactibacillus psychrotolerans]GEQ36603.1 cellobiose-specific PTS system IIB component [Marinilactibacil